MVDDSHVVYSIQGGSFQHCSTFAIRYRMLMKALDGHTPYEMLYCVKLNFADLCAFGTLCAIAKLNEKLKKLINAAPGLWVKH